MLIGILAAVALVALAAWLIAWIRRASAYQRVIGAPDGESEYRCYGGIMCKALTTSGTMVRLDLLDWGIRIRGIPISRWIVPRWEARYDELAIGELVATQFSRHAVWFRLRGASGGMGFLSDHSPDILKTLERHEVPVNRSVQQISNVADLYGSGR